MLAYTDCLVLDGGRTPDGLFDALKTHPVDEEILELTYITCMYEMHATMCRALQLEYDNVPERVEEIPAPEGAGDILQAVDEVSELEPLFPFSHLADRFRYSRCGPGDRLRLFLRRCG